MVLLFGNEVECGLLVLWWEMLFGEVVGVDSNFFLVGGYLLLMLKMLFCVEVMFGVLVLMCVVFEYFDVCGLVCYLLV